MNSAANGSWFLTRYDDLVTAYKNTRAYSSDKKREFAPKYGDTLLYEHHTTSLVFNDPPAHTRVRIELSARDGNAERLRLVITDPRRFGTGELDR